jgi:hypothetical protein
VSVIGIPQLLLPQAYLVACAWLQVEKVMRALQVRRLHLWPRFRDEVVASLEASGVPQASSGPSLPTFPPPSRMRVERCGGWAWPPPKSGRGNAQGV